RRSRRQVRYRRHSGATARALDRDQTDSRRRDTRALRRELARPATHSWPALPADLHIRPNQAVLADDIDRRIDRVDDAIIGPEQSHRQTKSILLFGWLAAGQL